MKRHSWRQFTRQGLGKGWLLDVIFSVCAGSYRGFSVCKPSEEWHASAFIQRGGVLVSSLFLRSSHPPPRIAPVRIWVSRASLRRLCSSSLGKYGSNNVLHERGTPRAHCVTPSCGAIRTTESPASVSQTVSRIVFADGPRTNSISDCFLTVCTPISLVPISTCPNTDPHAWLLVLVIFLSHKNGLLNVSKNKIAMTVVCLSHT